MQESIKRDLFKRVLTNDSPWEQLLNRRNLAVFSGEAFDFTASLSAEILAQPNIRTYPELVALAFWLRRANIQKIASLNVFDNDAMLVPLARGLVLHIAPSNVDTIFVYSWVLSLLCGNRNILRVPSRPSVQISILLNCIDSVLSMSQSRALRERVSFLRYDASDDATAILSQSVDVRVIWGGDETVNRIRRIPLKPTAIDLSFPNKWSLSVVSYGYWKNLTLEEKKKLARFFAFDAYQFGQAACSSPRCVIWLAEEAGPVEVDLFWELVSQSLTDVTFQFSAVDYVNKLVASDLLSQKGLINTVPSSDNRILRLKIKPEQLGRIVEEVHQCDAGFFFEFQTNTLADVFTGLGRNIQTVSSAGVSSKIWKDTLMNDQLNCFDRIVPIGMSLDFSPVWDGFKLLSEFVRFVDLTKLEGN
jgi:hypothetical protein